MKKVLLSILLTLLPLFVSADSVEIDGIWYKLDKMTNEAQVVMSPAGTGMYMGDIIIPQSVKSGGNIYKVTSIESSAFSNSSIRTVTIQNGLTTLYSYTFSYCKELESISIPQSISLIEPCTIIGCPKLSSIAVEEGNTVYDSRDNCNAIIETASNKLLCGCISTIIPNGITSIGDWAFSSCGELISIIIPNTVTAIGERAFSNCSKLSSIEIPNSVLSIGQYAFGYCEGLKTIELPEGLECIKSNTFYGCIELKDITIPNSVKIIESGAFGQCSNLISLEIPNSVTQIDNAFFGCSSLKSIIVGSENSKYDSREDCNAIIETSTNTILLGCSGTTFPNSVKTIGTGAFSGSMLTSINISGGIENIQESAFEGCDKLTSIYIGAEVKDIRKGAFSLCQNLTSIIIDGNNTKYDSRDNSNAIIETQTNKLIRGCKTTVIPKTISTIGEFAFFLNPGIKFLTIPSSVQLIERGAFQYCDIQGLYCYAIEPPELLGDIFKYGSLAEIFVPASSLDLYKNSSWTYICNSINAIENESSKIDANAINIDGIFYIVDSQAKEAVVTSNPYGYNGDIEIPETIEHEGIKYKVTAICDSAFYSCEQLHSLSIPKSVVSIGESALYACRSLSSLIIPNSVLEIGCNAFAYCSSLSTANIPNSVKIIGEYAFANCTSLSTVNIPNQLDKICKYAFFNCLSLSSLDIPGSVKSIEGSAFQKCNGITAIDIPGNVKSIGINAFANCYNIKALNLSNGVEEIGEGAFSGLGYTTSITIPGSVCRIGDGAFRDNYGLTNINVTDVVSWCNTQIGTDNFDFPHYMFLNGEEIKDLILPDGISVIKKNTFSFCKSLRSVSLSSSVTEIEDNSFMNCTNLVSVKFSNNINKIGDYAFSRCGSLESVTIPEGVVNIGVSSFYCCSCLTTLSLPNSLLCIPNSAFSGCVRLKDVIIPNNISSIGNSAFEGCSSLTSLYISPSVNEIGNSAFSGCNGLTSIIVDNGNMVYDSRDNCNAIIETATNTLLIGCNNSTIPNSIQVIGGSAFKNCKELKTIEIPITVTQIQGNAFAGSGLTSVVIPPNVNMISSGTFSDCTSLSSVEIPNSVNSIGGNAFWGCTSLSSLTIPNSVKYIGGYAFAQCMGLLSINIPNSVTSIGSWAFYACHSLKNASIPNSIEEIGYWFSYCIKLESISIPRSAKKITKRAFEGCYVLNDVYCFADEVPEMGSEAIIFPIIDNNTTLHVPANSIEKYKKAYIWNKFGTIVALTDEEIAIYNANNPEIAESTVSNSIEGIYMTQPDSYRVYQGSNQTFGRTFEVMIIDNGDGTYYVDDLWGGWYNQRAGYGPNYSMTGNVGITTNGIVSLKDSYVTGWGDSLKGLTGSYDSERKTFTIEADYVEGMHFYQTWVKVGDIFTVDGIIYGVGENNTVSVKRGNYSGDIRIPNEVSHNGFTYQIMSVDGAFNDNTNLISVSLPNSVKSINGAFRGCTALKSVNIPNCVTSIERYDFEDCASLTSIDIPNGVTSIGENAFVGCKSLTKVNIPNSVTSIGEWAFAGCTNLTTVIIPSSVVSIGDAVFLDCNNLADIILSDGLITIGNDAFSYINLRSLTIPKSVLRIGDHAFTSCEDIESIRVDNENVKYDSRGNCDAIIETYTNRLILGCKNTIIPQDVTVIGEWAFADCFDLKSFNIPSSVKVIEKGAFYQCTGLSSIHLDNNVREIGASAFSGCNRVKTVIIPHKINAINWRTFEHCYDLRDFYCYAESYPTTDKEAFFETPIENATLHVPANLIDTYKSTAPWSGFGKIVALTSEEMSKYGDVNGDGVVNVSDIVYVVNIIKKGATSQFFRRR